MEIKNILAPTDFSDCSKRAVSYAIEMALNLKARLYLMHSMQSTFSLSSERLLERLINDDRFQKVDAQTLTEFGDPSASILRQAKEIEADLIVIGSKGSSGGRKFLGSTTTEVISKSGVPVLAIPQKSTYSGFEDIVFMTDFNEGDLSALKEISGWARHFNANLHVLHLFTDDSLEELIKFRGFREVALEGVNYEKLSFERVFNASFKKGIVDYMATHEAQLIVLTRYKKTFYEKMMQTDHARKIEFESIIPFLSLAGERYAEEEQEDRTIKQ
ncbi:universal stress protein [Fodinibius sediminis]|uniref:Nucleotide-binding universal stress protein, UspA family n=1 Tax=Fodinibius sediminis TaxID=1214077 RepID=A0A521CI95_9BACT|nr:universal stress protein [Fodinibius sediminis]SMO58461.1 Nucleotide-binding universal stress protein, UspA family [Fodinibius sediminis]